MKQVSEQTILITGSTDGLGKGLAIELATQGACIILHGRNTEKGRSVQDEIISFSGNKKIKYFNADFSSLQSVRNLGAEVRSKYQNLDILINNAGIGGAEARELSTDGYELCFAVNYLAPFLLTHLLLPVLQQKSTTKILNIASGAQQELDFQDIMLHRNYSGSRAYAQSKLALIMLTFTLAGQYKDSELRVNAMHPESLMNTKMVLERYGSAESTVAEGVRNVLHVAESAVNDNFTGAYFNKTKISKAEDQAYDIVARDKLYRLSKDLVQL